MITVVRTTVIEMKVGTLVVCSVRYPNIPIVFRGSKASERWWLGPG